MVEYVVNGDVEGQDLNSLFDAAWPSHKWTDFPPVLEASLFHVLAYDSDALVGFVRVAGCGGPHGIIFGPTVHPEYQRQGVGTALLNEAGASALERGVQTLHVEFAAMLAEFYARAGYRHTAAGVRRLS